MPALIMSNAVFLHAPRTGGTWAGTALRKQGIVLATICDADGASHPSLAVVRVVSALPVITTVREPVTWLRSFWRFFYARNWRQPAIPIAALDPLLSMATPHFGTFVARYLHRRPGYLSRLLASFADGADHVCRQEHLSDDLQVALAACGQPFVPAVFATTPEENRSRGFQAELAPEVEAKVRDVDRWIVDRFYGGLSSGNAADANR